MNKKIITLRVIFAILLIATYSVIFVFSSENGEKSSNTSKGIMYNIIDGLNGEKEVTQQDIDTYEPILRKLAHFGIYTMSGVWSMCLMCTFFKNKEGKVINKKTQLNSVELKRICIATTIGFIYACSDEIHQLFSFGRSGEIIDVLLDTIGVINGALIVMLIIAIFNEIKSLKKTSN